MSLTGFLKNHLLKRPQITAMKTRMRQGPLSIGQAIQFLPPMIGLFLLVAQTKPIGLRVSLTLIKIGQLLPQNITQLGGAEENHAEEATEKGEAGDAEKEEEEEELAEKVGEEEEVTAAEKTSRNTMSSKIAGLQIPFLVLANGMCQQLTNTTITRVTVSRRKLIGRAILFPLPQTGMRSRVILMNLRGTLLRTGALGKRLEIKLIRLPIVAFCGFVKIGRECQFLYLVRF